MQRDDGLPAATSAAPSMIDGVASKSEVAKQLLNAHRAPEGNFITQLTSNPFFTAVGLWTSYSRSHAEHNRASDLLVLGQPLHLCDEALAMA